MFTFIKSLKLPLIVLAMCFLAITAHDWLKTDDRVTILLRDTPFITAALDFFISEPELELPAESFGKTIFDTPQGSGFAADVLIDKAAGRAFEPLINYSEEFPWRVNGKSVGRLDIFWEGENGKKLRRPNKPCTAFFVDTDKIMTAGHCGGVEDSFVLDVEPKPLEHEYNRDDNDTVDYALLQIVPESLNKIAEIDRPEPLNFVADGSDKLTEKQRLYVLHHPKANPLRLTNYSCRTTDKRAVRKRRIAHVCDTLPGSSGAPIFAVPGDYVVGVNDDAPNFGQHVAGLARLSKEKAGIIFKLIDPKPFLTKELLRLEKYVHQWALEAYEQENYALSEIMAVAGFENRALTQSEFPASAKEAESRLLQAVVGNAEIGFIHGKSESETLAYSRERSELAIGTDDGSVKIYDLPLKAGMGPKKIFDARHQVKSIAYSPDGTHLAVGNRRGMILIFDVSKPSRANPITGFLPNSREEGFESIDALAYSPDGMHIASAVPNRSDESTRIFDGSTINIFKTIDSPGSSPTNTIKTDSFVFALDYSPNAPHLAIGLSNGKARIYDTSTQSTEPIKTFDTGSTVFSIKYSPHDGHLATGSRDGNVRIYDPSADSNDPSQILKGDDRDWVMSIDFSHTKKQLATGSREKMIRVYDLNNQNEGSEKTPVKSFETPSRVSDVVYSSLSKDNLAVVLEDKTVRIYDLSAASGSNSLQRIDAPDPVSIIYQETFGATPTKADIISIIESSVTSLSFLGNKNLLASGYRDGKVQIYDLDRTVQKKTVLTIDAESWVNSISYSSTRKHLAVGTADGEDSTVQFRDDGGVIRIYDLSDFSINVPKYVFPTKSQVIRILYAPDGKQLVAGCRDGSILIFDISSEYKINSKKLDTVSKTVNAMVYLGQNRQLAVGSQDRVVRIYDTSNSSLTAPQKTLTHNGASDWDWITSMSYSPSRNLLATNDLEGSVRLYDIANTKNKTPIARYNNLQGAINFSKDGNRLAAAGNRRQFGAAKSENKSRVIDVLNSYNANLMQSFDSQSDVFAIAFSPDGERLVTGAEDGTISVYHTPSLRGGELLRHAQERLKASERLSESGNFHLTRDECQKFPEFCNSLN